MITTVPTLASLTANSINEHLRNASRSYNCGNIRDAFDELVYFPSEFDDFPPNRLQIQADTSIFTKKIGAMYKKICFRFKTTTKHNDPQR